MDTSGNVYTLSVEERLKVGHFKLTSDEAEQLQRLEREVRVESLRQMRADALPIPKRPRSVLPRSLRRPIDSR